MKDQAIKNLVPISLEQVKNLIKEKNPTFFDKMIISSNEIVHRTNFYYLNYSAETLNRFSKVIDFPLFGSIKDNFKDFQGGKLKFGEKSKMNSTYILNSLSESFKIHPKNDASSNLTELEYPINVSGERVSNQQDYFFLPERTTSWVCKSCSGNKYVRCKDYECKGRHEWDCITCSAKGNVVCEECAGKGKVSCKSCKGSSKKRCTTCGGDGKVYDPKKHGKSNDQKKCGNCSGKGEVICGRCHKGDVTCSNCDGGGKTTCSTCDGYKTIKCSECYGDKARYGMIDCGECQAIGEMAKISYVETKLNVKSIERIFFDKNNIKDLTPDVLMRYANKITEQVNILKNFNDVFEKKYDEFVEKFIAQIHTELILNYEGYKSRVTNEELYYQVIPCVQIEYRHMITNAIHKATILNFFENPELVLEKEIENTKKTSKDNFQKIGNFLGKLFKTKKYKVKEDKKREIRLMIMLTKIDGKTEEEEKIFLSSQISNLNEFSKTEKIDFFTLMDSKTLPELTKNDVVFYYDIRFNETIQKLESLAQKDGEAHIKESGFIEKIKNLNEIHTKKKKQ